MQVWKMPDKANQLDSRGKKKILKSENPSKEG
jgi:hypothetical protein